MAGRRKDEPLGDMISLRLGGEMSTQVRTAVKDSGLSRSEWLRFAIQAALRLEAGVAEISRTVDLAIQPAPIVEVGGLVAGRGFQDGGDYVVGDVKPRGVVK